MNDPRWDRRNFLRAAAAAGGAALLRRVGPAWAATAETLPVIEERRATGGLLDTEMTLDFADNTVDGFPIPLHTRTIEGRIPGPTLRLRPGDALRVHFHNKLPPNPDKIIDINIPHHFNTFTFHTHGLHVSPSGIADNVFRKLEPGRWQETLIEIPENHPGGIFWYHAHKHGAVRAQLTSGMAGAIVIDGRLDKVPAIAAARTRVLVIQEVRVKNGNGRVLEVGESERDFNMEVFWLLNGAQRPTLVMRPGEVQRLQVVYSGLALTRELRLEGHDWHRIGQDGIALYAPIRSGSVALAPGNRVDVLVKAGEPGTYALQLHTPGRNTTVIGYVTVEGEPADMMTLPETLPSEPLHPSIEDAEITGRRTLVFGDLGGRNFVIDGKLFDADRIDYALRLGDVEEWTIRNDTPVSHPFHIHTNAFEVIEVDGAPLDQKIWMDVVDVAAMSSVKFRTRFQDFTGKLVLHCHIAGHADSGMMNAVRIFDPRTMTAPIRMMLSE